MRIGILAAVVLSSTLGLMPSALAQTIPEEQEGEPPREEPMQGPSPGTSMSQMMRGPGSTEFYPTLIRISELDPVERERLELRAQRWVSEGLASISEGTAALSEATRRDDVRAMEQAGATIGQGLSQLENGLAARRALESGEPPQQVALEWFKSQLNLPPAQMDSKATRILSLTPFPRLTAAWRETVVRVTPRSWERHGRSASHATPPKSGF